MPTPFGDLGLIADLHDQILAIEFFRPNETTEIFAKRTTRGKQVTWSDHRSGDLATHPVLREIGEYLLGNRKTFTEPIIQTGSDFQRRVWKELMRIPCGGCISYAELARRVGSTPRAVGRANATNPLSIVVPCHRVVGSDGSLTGYGGGLTVKQQLLQHEQTMTAAAGAATADITTAAAAQSTVTAQASPADNSDRQRGCGNERRGTRSRAR